MIIIIPRTVFIAPEASLNAPVISFTVRKMIAAIIRITVTAVIVDLFFIYCSSLSVLKLDFQGVIKRLKNIVVFLILFESIFLCLDG